MKKLLIKILIKILEWWYYKIRKYPRIFVEDDKIVEPEGEYRI